MEGAGRVRTLAFRAGEYVFDLLGDVDPALSISRVANNRWIVAHHFGGKASTSTETCAASAWPMRPWCSSPPTSGSSY
jgi:hypothetical protein